MSEEERTILVVDDDPIVLAVTEERLGGLGFEVTTRDQALGTSQWVLQNKPWMVLLDVNMPAMTGGALAQFMKSRGLRTHIVFHSGQQQSELDSLAKDTGAVGSIGKGLDDLQFERCFKKVLKDAETREATQSAGA